VIWERIGRLGKEFVQMVSDQPLWDIEAVKPEEEPEPPQHAPLGQHICGFYCWGKGSSIADIRPR
jgi:hypothetical protein